MVFLFQVMYVMFKERRYWYPNVSMCKLNHFAKQDISVRIVKVRLSNLRLENQMTKRKGESGAAFNRISDVGRYRWRTDSHSVVIFAPE